MPFFVAAVAVPVSASSDTQMGTNLLTGLFFHMLDEMWPLTKKQKRRYKYKFMSHVMFNLYYVMTEVHHPIKWFTDFPSIFLFSWVALYLICENMSCMDENLSLGIYAF